MGKCCSKKETDPELEQGVIKIQAHFRGKKVRKELKGAKRKTKEEPVEENHEKEHLEPEKPPEVAHQAVSPPSHPPEAQNEHAPSSDVAILLERFPHYANPGIQTALSKLGSFEYSKGDPEFEGLPVLGPYQIIKDNSVYEGQWRYGQRCGRGKQIWEDGSVYEGYWANNKANGRGRLVHANGDIYQGDWIDDKAFGYGEFIHRDGGMYKGNWKNDKQVHIPETFKIS